MDTMPVCSYLCLVASGFSPCITGFLAESDFLSDVRVTFKKLATAVVS